MSTSKKKTLTRTVRSSVAVAAGVLLALAFAPPASADAGRANVTNSGSQTLTVCRNASSETVCAGPTGELQRGQDSNGKFGWSDTDMVRVPANCRIEHYTWSGASGHHWQAFASGGASGRWLKLSGTPVGTKNYSFRTAC